MVLLQNTILPVVHFGRKILEEQLLMVHAVLQQVKMDMFTLPQPTRYNDPMFIACADSGGHALWVIVLISGGEDGTDANAVAVGPSGCICIGGDFAPPSTLIFGNDS